MDSNGVFKLLSLENRKNQAQVIVSGFSELEIECTKRARIISDEQAAKVKEVWNEHLKSRPNDFDGSTLSLKRITVEGKKVQLLCRASKYSEFMVSRKECKIGRLKICSQHNSIDFHYPVPVSFGMVVRTKPTKEHPNGCIIAAIRGDTTFESGKATFLPGGYIDPDKDAKRINDGKKVINLNDVIMREYKEELPRLKRWNKEPKILAIVHSLVESCQPAIIGWFEIPYTAEEVASICGEKFENEIQKIIFVPADIESLRVFAQKYSLCIHDVYKLVYYLADTM